MRVTCKISQDAFSLYAKILPKNAVGLSPGHEIELSKLLGGGVRDSTAERLANLPTDAANLVGHKKPRPSSLWRCSTNAVLLPNDCGRVARVPAGTVI